MCIREVQNSLKDSIKQLLVDKIEALGVGSFFQILESEIRGPDGSIIIFRGMQSYTATTIKSLEGYDIALVEEAQDFSQRSLDMLRPTIRKNGSEIWFVWNPESENDAVDKFFRGPACPPDAIVRQVNWNDNPWFPDVLRKEMDADAGDPEKFAHIWNGAYRALPKGSYYGALFATARTEGRLGRVPHDPLCDVHVSFDLGVGRNMALWFAQWVGREFRLIDYLEGDEMAADIGLGWYAKKLKELPYTYAPLILPHDARSRELGTGKSREEMLIALGFKTEIVPKMDPEDRIELVKRYIPSMYIDAVKCAVGVKHACEYRENYDEKLRISRGPLHDFTSHAADSLGHMCQAYEAPKTTPPKSVRTFHGTGSWMG